MQHSVYIGKAGRALSRPRFWLALVAGSALLFANPGQATDIPDRQTIEEHIRALYTMPGDTPPKIRKWTVPVRWIVVGISDPERFALIVSKFARLREILPLDIAPVTEDPGRRANMYLIFSDNAAEFARTPVGMAIFKHKSETEAEYMQRVNSFDESETQSIFRGSGESLTFAAILRDLRGFKYEFDAEVSRSIFDFLVMNNASDVIRPSIANRNITGLDGLTAIDEAFLSALYDPQVSHRMSLDQAMPMLVEGTIDALDNEQ